MLTSKRYTHVRWYVIDKSWNKLTTSSYIIDATANTSWLYFVSLEKNSVEEGVEINAAPVVAYYGVLALWNVWLKIHDIYTTVKTCEADGFFSINCAVDLWLTVIPVSWLKQSKNVLEFAGSSKKHAGSVRKTNISQLLNNLIIPQKIKNDYVIRWWSDNLIKNVIKSPYTTRRAKNKATGNSATAFYQKDWSYLVTDDKTFTVIQVSKIWDKDWIPDSTIIKPYLP